MSAYKLTSTNVAFLVMLFTSHAAMALDPVSYGEGVIGPQKNATEVQALGANLFGEEVNTYTGGLAFSQTDLSLPGNDNLPVKSYRHLMT